ncbi:unnamed protein product [Amoebophrya sp. A120]|nr:unnamed protein product [Amoebophrya sp. A120]|eukprot:GSA120T00023139001.1
MSTTARSANAAKLGFSRDVLEGKVAIISGSTRGIGRECALALAREGCRIVVAGKSLKSTPELPGSIYSVADEVRACGSEAISVQLDVLSEESIIKCVEAAVEKWGRVDICVNNASALWWQTINDTPSKKYDLITRLNTRGSFLLTKHCLPHMRKNKFGRVICMSPPIELEKEAYKGLCAYNISKMGMTMVALGAAAAEGVDDNILANSLWPATVIESQASINFDLGDKKLWRKATILADATVSLCCDQETTGQMLIDDEYLTEVRGLTKDDLKTYRYDPNTDPPRLLAEKTGSMVTRGDVRKVKQERRTDDFEKAKNKSKL